MQLANTCPKDRKSNTALQQPAYEVIILLSRAFLLFMRIHQTTSMVKRVKTKSARRKVK